jgi:chromosome partitioning protein
VRLELPRIIAIVNQKGGVGKSTTAVNLGAALAVCGRRVLIVDSDPQGNATTGLGIDKTQVVHDTYDVLLRGIAAEAAIVPTELEALHLLAATIDLAGAEIELVSALSRETRLRQALAPVAYR